MSHVQASRCYLVAGVISEIEKQLMHMMFVDESGDPGYPPSGNWQGWGGTRLFVRVGVIIHGWKWKTWHQRLFEFKHNRGLTWDAEIKADSRLRDQDVAPIESRGKKSGQGDFRLASRTLAAVLVASIESQRRACDAIRNSAMSRQNIPGVYTLMIHRYT